MSETGLVQVYCGDGEKKTTAAIGAIVRAVERGYWALVVRLLKMDDSGEVNGLVHIPGITVLPCDQNFGFSWNVTQSQRKAITLHYGHCLLTAWNMALEAGGEEPYGILMLDEATRAYNLGFVSESGLVKIPKEKPASLEVILIGRCPSEVLQEQTDYITEMVMGRHLYERRIGAGERIEYQGICSCIFKVSLIECGRRETSLNLRK